MLTSLEATMSSVERRLSSTWGTTMIAGFSVCTAALESRTAAREDVILADCWEEIRKYSLYTGQSIDALMREDGCLSDGLHPTDRVYRMMASCILRAMGLTESVIIM